MGTFVIIIENELNSVMKSRIIILKLYPNTKLDKGKDFQFKIFRNGINKEWAALLPNNEALFGKYLNK